MLTKFTIEVEGQDEEQTDEDLQYYIQKFLQAAGGNVKWEAVFECAFKKNNRWGAKIVFEPHA